MLGEEKGAMICLQEKGAMMQNKKKTDHIPWKLLKAVFHKIYLAHSWALSLLYFLKTWAADGGLNKDWDSQLQGYDF